MAINIDTIYQRVLAIANKEQRGYITPQEYNLFANQAQMEIFDQYFYDLNQAIRVPGNQSEYADVDDMLEEKLQVFEESDGAAVVAAYQGAGNDGINKVLPDYVYRVHRVEFVNVNCEILNTSDFNDVRFSGPLVKPTNSRPVANIRSNILRVVGSQNNFITPTGVFYFRKPKKAEWGYVVVSEKALWDPSQSTDFELHPSEENNLVFKILRLAGINMGGELYQVGQQEDIKSTQLKRQ